jgi:hypothetical protein
MKPTKKIFFRGFWLNFHRPLTDGSSVVFCSDYKPFWWVH